MVILDRRLITRQYLMSWFLLDLFSSIPLELFFMGQSSGDGEDSTQYTRTTKSMKLLRLLKLARIAKASRIITRWGNH